MVTRLITTHEPPSSLLAVRVKAPLDLEPSSFGAGDRRAKSEVVRRIFGEVSLGRLHDSFQRPTTTPVDTAEVILIFCFIDCN